MLNKTSRVALLIILVVASGSVLSQPEKYVAGTHYDVLSAPVRTVDANKIEVVEAFWYGCPHCFSFEPLIVDWAENIPEDVNFVRFPAMFNSLMKIHAQIFFTAENRSALDLVHDSVYQALILENRELQTESQIEDFFADSGVDREDFRAAFDSFSVRTKLQQAEQRMRDYDLRGTPSMIVNGKYRVMTGSAVKTQQEMLQVVDFLIDKERKAH